MRPELRISEDGSSTLYRADLDEHYHSFHGAIQESMHVFIEAGLKNVRPKSALNILEIGFGTGLNALLTWIHKPEGIIHYHGLEKYPVDPDLTALINYPQLLGGERVLRHFSAMHAGVWDQEMVIQDDFLLTKLKVDLCDFEFKTRYDLVYFDAFAPEKQPELWTDTIFRNIFNKMSHGGVLTTYSAKGAVRRSMQAAGFEVERIPGPPGKREMLRATKE
ncbi:tRNA (5-methylaminomethyl-2-thiouridine)(34)-methyltransferase MnmD [Geofilum rubicundum]|uniref:Putative peptidase n=1 Tax=Geofilum rubicundum JCM 15548 TaxID=1236989 RepID=A0A0E9LY24_9BACT|nr:tRNA (5-methylaminomethyl-2-thiouridine)(34)-methyltransferase MnmD [Geofilum rubicundum]GAO30203.1 putative peptidase [Geofilum rubicundum JCM 15548]